MKLTDEQIKRLDNLVVFGAGEAAKSLVSFFKLNDKPFHMVSSFGGGKFNERDVKRFDDLEQSDSNRPYNIIIASQYFYDIFKMIQESHIKHYHIYCFNVYMNEVLPVQEVLRQSQESKTLYAIYDLEQNPASFDACVFANAAEVYRIANDYNKICFVIVPPILKYGRLCDANFYENGNVQAFKERVDSLLIPIFSLIPSNISTAYLPNRNDVSSVIKNKHIFPINYDQDKPVDTHNPMKMFELPNPIGFFKAPRRSVKFVDDCFFKLKHKHILTFTVREYLDEPTRNNDLVQLSLFIKSLDLNKFHPVIVRDTANAGKATIRNLEQYQCFSMASMDIGVRMALYETATMNFFCNNGTASLAAFSKKCNYVILKLKDETIRCTNSDFFRERFGIDETHEQYLWANNINQRINWNYDSFGNMTNEFNRFLSENNIEK